jgi:hypothetical protein
MKTAAATGPAIRPPRGAVRQAIRALKALRPRCAGCGELFKPVRPGQRVCRPSCRQTETPVLPGLFSQEVA